jgi:prepilin-type N-terminal cleavage/methylation domain-containing protein
MYAASTGKSAFTLVEMLVSMAILGMIVLLMGRIFADGSNAYKQGLKSSDQNLNGRVIMDFIARELKQAVIDDNLVLRISSSPADPYGTELNDWISFASVGGEGKNTREVELLSYYVQQEDTKEIGGVSVGSYTLNRGYNPDPDDINDAYRGECSGWPSHLDCGGESSQMARNISGFAIKLYDYEDGGSDIECIRDIGEDVELDELPLFADIYMGIMGDSDLVEAAITGDRDFIAKREMVFIKRVYFRNRAGYNTAYGRELFEADD